MVCGPHKYPVHSTVGKNVARCYYPSQFCKWNILVCIQTGVGIDALTKSGLTDPKSQIWLTYFCLFGLMTHAPKCGSTFLKENKGSLETAHHISVFLLKFTGPLSQFDAERCVHWLFSVFSSWVETMSWLTPISRKIIRQTASIRLGIFRVFIIIINK